ncbi:hypothetical protein [Streptomyces sp. CC77]|uniref:hypothetical protein n=1 Tax=Streptomyces sp. CC77 TaxID=1906739 RepID=UPI0008DD600E|nr:hypothetical protein [Streptomyces sp. CC77]OII66642.1 hypothetical protein BJP39_08220 [Streptomyces sp. CC77]
MRHVRIAPLPDGYGYNLDPQPYRDALPGLLDALPPGARRFAADPGHYDFTGPRCVKDLTLARSTLTDSEGTLTLDLAFAPNEWKHPDALHLRYADVRAFRPDADEPDGLLPRLGALQLDELLPHRTGVSHELAFVCGTLTVHAADLTAAWH